VSEVKAQDPEFTQFYANPLYLNPAFAGSMRCPRVVMNYRNQWPRINGTYVTYSASYDQHVEAISGGLGFIVTNDQAGQGTLNTTNVSAIYSYYLPVTREFSFKAGFQAGYAQKSVDWEKLNFGDMIDPQMGFSRETNEARPNTTVSNVDFSAGILGYSKSFYIGAAAHHLLEPDESFGDGLSPLPMKITAHTGAIIALADNPRNRRRRTRGKNVLPESSISPNVLYRRQGDFQQLNLGLYVTKGPVVGGLWYRNQDAFIVLVGIQTPNFRFGYSYDVTISKLSNATAGSHELSMTVQFDCRPKKKKFVPVSCPSF
jgi:type IX secretion system PorP/SprF family membrane protein